MSLVITTPELVQGAAQDLAGIGSSLAEATATAASPTTGIAAAAQDEVSVAIASMFGNFGQEFQALSAQAQAFHAEFVSAMNGSAAAYVSAEAAAGQTLMSAAAAPAQTLFGGGAAMVTGQGAATMAQGISSFVGTVAAPYQALAFNTQSNLQAINSTFAANPFPFVNQVIGNQTGFANTFGSGILTDLQGFPGNVPANIQLAIQGASTFNPGALLQGFIAQQQGYAYTIGSSLQLAGQDLYTGVQGLPAGFQAAFQDLAAGNPIGAYGQIQQTLQNAFLPGFQEVNVPWTELGSPTATPVPIIPLGPLGDLAPIFAIPGHVAQNFTNLLPAGSIPAQISQNFTNVLNTVTNFGTTLNPGTLGINFGLPLQFVFDGIGAPANALSALNSSAVAFASAVQTGNASAAAAAVLDAPAVVANGFLNGQTLISLPPVTVNFTGAGFPIDITTNAELPLGGLLTPLSPVILGGGVGPIPGTPIGGFIPGLQSIGSQLAAAITPTT